MTRYPAASPRAMVATGLTKRYRGQTVVADASVTLAPGAILALMGPNGAGKSTTYRMLIGTESPDRGRILIDGRDVTGLPDYARARCGLGYLPQEPSAFPGLSVADNILLALENHERDRAARKARLVGLLADMDLTAVRDVKAGRLSGGQRRRCEIARLLAGRPRYVLLDEPFAGLDPLAVAQVKAQVRALAAQGIGVLITDHNVPETLSLVDRVLVLVQGQVVYDGAADTVLDDPALKGLWLGEDFSC